MGGPVRAASRSGNVRFDWADRATWKPARRGVNEQIREVDAHTARLVEGNASQLLDEVGTGPDMAVTLLITVRWGNPEWLDSQASFAALARGQSVPRDAGELADGLLGPACPGTVPGRKEGTGAVDGARLWSC